MQQISIPGLWLVDFASFQSQHPYCRIPTFLSVDETVGETVIISIQSCATLQGGVNTRKAPPVTIEVHGITSWMRRNGKRTWGCDPPRDPGLQLGGRRALVARESDEAEIYGR